MVCMKSSLKVRYLSTKDFGMAASFLTNSNVDGVLGIDGLQVIHELVIGLNVWRTLWVDNIL